VFNSEQNSVGTGGLNCSGAGGCAVFDDVKLRASVGAGLIWVSPFGPLRFEVAYPLLKSSTDQTQWWNFSIATSF
jgi:outer membrane protein insertion porin family